MAYADYLDANNKYLNDSVVSFTSNNDFAPELESAERTIRAYLSGRVLPVTVATWVTPAATPEFIREIAAKLAAALRYRRLHAVDVPQEISAYAQQLYDEAIATLTDINNGTLDLVGLGVTDLDSAGMLTPDHFWPNDDAIGTPDDQKFAMGMEF